MNFERKINKEKGMLGGRKTNRKECWEEDKQRERNVGRKRREKQKEEPRAVGHWPIRVDTNKFFLKIFSFDF